ncbi:hypothetical protein BC332_24247 [Capsicum chinense]|nr:hypothetical protein BC332_24247 [Capsicum chinense]
MESTAKLFPARLDRSPGLKSMETTTHDSIPPKRTYMNAISGIKGSNSVARREKVIAMITKHNGMSAVIFDAEDYYADKDVNDHIKYFKFLNFWAEQDGFYKLVRQMWSADQQNSFWIVHQKLEKLKFGDIFTKVQQLEDKLDQYEIAWMMPLD